MKFALFLIVALCAAQGYSAQPLEAKKFERDLNDIINTIKEFIEKVKQVIEQVANQIPQIINGIKEKINEILGKIPEIIDGIKQKIDELIALGEAGRKCAEAARPDIEALVQGVQDGVQACASAAEEQADSIRLLVENLVKEANNLRDDIQNRLVKCVQDNPLNPIGLYNCLKNQVEPIQQAVAELEETIKAAVNTATQIVQKTVVDLGNCVAAVQEDTLQKEQAIVEGIEKCIQENTQA